MTIFIIEDERPAADRIAALARAYDPSVVIAGTAPSVADAVEWLRTRPAPDLIVSDIRLSDGTSFEVFEQVPVTAPVIFITAHDEHLIDAFTVHAVDYLLKPVQRDKFHRALAKYAALRQHFSGSLTPLLERLRGERTAPERIVARKGGDFVALRPEDIAYLYTEHKMVFAVGRDGRRCVVDRPLGDLAGALDPARFFRLNRKYLANIDAVERFRPHDKGRVLVVLVPPVSEEVTVSQENAAAFRAWMGG